MVKVNIYIDNLSNITKFTVKGHANYDDYGKDIVCSAVSVLAQTTILSLNKVCMINEKDLDYTIDDGYTEVNLPKNIDNIKLEKSQIVLKTFETGIRSIVESYPKHVTLKCREV